MLHFSWKIFSISLNDAGYDNYMSGDECRYHPHQKAYAFSLFHVSSMCNILWNRHKHNQTITAQKQITKCNFWNNQPSHSHTYTLREKKIHISKTKKENERKTEIDDSLNATRFIQYIRTTKLFSWRLVKRY